MKLNGFDCLADNGVSGVLGGGKELIVGVVGVFGINVGGLAKLDLEDGPEVYNKGFVKPGGATTGAVSTISSSNFLRLISLRLLLVSILFALREVEGLGVGLSLGTLGV